MDFFKEENIIPQMMNYYRDFSYVEYILDLPFDRGYKLFKKFQEDFKNSITEKSKDRIFKIWLIDLQNGYKGDFETYFKNQQENTNINNMSKKEKQNEESRIIKEIEEKNKITKLKIKKVF